MELREDCAKYKGENTVLRERLNKADQQLSALRLVCGTTDANKFETALDRAHARRAELENEVDRLCENLRLCKQSSHDPEKVRWLVDGALFPYKRAPKQTANP